MSFPQSVADKALVSCGRHCCICHKFAGTNIELHHIQPQGQSGANTFENCIPLCFECHAEVGHYNPSHPKGRKFSKDELIGHRDSWYTKVESGGGIVASIEHLPMDRALFAKIVTILPHDGSIQLLRERSIGNVGLQKVKLYQIEEYLHFAENNPSYEFMDSDLEGNSRELFNKVEDFFERLWSLSWLDNINGETDRNPNNEYYRVPPEWKSKSELMKKYYDDVHEIDDSALAVAKAYDNFIRLGRRKLALS